MFINEILWSHFHLHSVSLIESRYRTAAWHTLGQLPDFDNMSSASHCVSQGGYNGKSQSICNFHACLEIILEPFIGNQGNDSKAIYANVPFGDKVAVCHCFFPWHM